MATESTTNISSPIEVPAVTVPPLEPGDRLTSAEFERRYMAMPGVKKAELIEGTVHMPSPVRMDAHARPQADLLAWLGLYRSATPGVHAGDNATLKLDNDNVPQPDALLMISPEYGGQAAIDEQGYLNGPPELVAEVASSSVSIDLNAKKHVYRRCGIREYLVWRVLDNAIDWFILRDGEYTPIVPNDRGILSSDVFPGLFLDPRAMLDGKLDVVLASLQGGIGTPEHAAFVERLAAHGTR